MEAERQKKTKKQATAALTRFSPATGPGLHLPRVSAAAVTRESSATETCGKGRENNERPGSI